MKFFVRKGFVVIISKTVEVGGRSQLQESSFYEGDEIDIDVATADEHAHKLEPADKKAEAYLASKHPAPVPAAVAPGQIDYVLLAQAIVAAQALAAATPAAPANPA